MATKSDALRIARHRHPGEKLFARFVGKAPTAERLSEIRERRKVIGEALEYHRQNAIAAKKADVHGELLKAAQFVCDVNGDEPSIPQLREAAARVRELNEIMDMIHELETERKNLEAESCISRCAICKPYRIEGLGIGTHTIAHGATWDEVIERLC